MSHYKFCKFCGGVGIMLICYEESNDYDAVACTCKKGQYWRLPGQLATWAALQTPKPIRVGRLEEFYTDEAMNAMQPEFGPSIAEMFL